MSAGRGAGRAGRSGPEWAGVWAGQGGWLVVAGRVEEALPGQLDLCLGLLPAGPVRAFDALAGLECLVDLEEVLDLELVELGQMANVLQVLEPGVVGRH